MKSSDYKSDAEHAKAMLGTVSKTMCLAKWNQVSLHLPTGMTNSCYHPPLHKMFILLEHRGHRRDVGQALSFRGAMGHAGL